MPEGPFCQIHAQVYSASKCEISDVISDVMICIASLTEAVGVENSKSKNFSKSELFWYQNVSHALTKKMTTHT